MLLATLEPYREVQHDALAGQVEHLKGHGRAVRARVPQYPVKQPVAERERPQSGPHDADVWAVAQHVQSHLRSMVKRGGNVKWRYQEGVQDDQAEE